LAKLIKFDRVEMQKAFVIGNKEVKNENKESAHTIRSVGYTGNNDDKDYDKVDENEHKVKIEKLEQLRIKLQKETDEIKENANQLSDNIIQDANSRAIQIIQDATEKAKDILSEKEQEGYQNGYNEAMQKYESLLKEAKSILDDAEEYRNNVFKNQEKEIVNLVLQCVSKIIRQKMSDEDTLVTNIIMSSIEDLNSRKKLLVKISREDFEETTMIRNKILATFPGVKDIEIKIVDGYLSGDIEIESEDGTVNPSIKAQFIKLREEFSKLLEGDKE
jgi:flagellar assembly protein fliH